jgi:hypothetical protein
MTTTHGLVVEQVADALLVEWMCQVRPGLSPGAAGVALQALRSLHMAVHRDGDVCGEQPAPEVCGATTSGLFGANLACVLHVHVDGWHDNGRGTQWQCMSDGGWQLKQGPGCG